MKPTVVLWLYLVVLRVDICMESFSAIRVCPQSSCRLVLRSMLMDLTTERGWHVEDIYFDDGISGTTFERVSFRYMFAVLEM
ncbi:MAG: hypothetical protein MJA31_02055 [Clostridia bacterium]|nr:hypothetical protein [Clostridia bacterium]